MRFNMLFISMLLCLLKDAVGSRVYPRVSGMRGGLVKGAVFVYRSQARNPECFRPHLKRYEHSTKRAQA